MNIRVLFLSTLTCLLAACAANPVPEVRRDADLSRVGAATAGTTNKDLASDGQDLSGPQPEIRRGSQPPLRDAAPVSGSTAPVARQRGSTSFNFQGEPLQSVIAVILGDMLGQKYAISPAVQGTVTLNTPKPVTHAEALQLLDTVLGWNNARMIYSGGRYNIVPADQALNSGMVSPRGGGGSTAGYQVRPERLRYVSAGEMKKILEPYARPNAIVGVDSARNIITLAGSSAELANYERTIQTFDVDWMSSMSVGVYPLQSGNASKVVADLERVFGEQSKSPGAGMFRFMPLDSANAVMVIAAQPGYLDRIQSWIDRLDGGGGGGSRLYTQELRYISARDLAQRLSEVFGGNSNQNGQAQSPSMMPGLQSTEIGDGDINSSTSNAPITGSNGGATTGSGGAPIGQMSLPQRNNGVTSANFKIGRDEVGVSAVDENNAILVRASPAAWKSIREVIEKLDVMPLQVHIEAQVVEVKLTGDLKYGVNWYFGNMIPSIYQAAAAARNSLAVGGGANEGDGNGLVVNVLGGNSVAVISALDKVTDVHLLQTPSVIVRNNTEATLNVGSRIPIASVSVNPGTGTGNTTYSQVQYMDTGTILKVRPRVTRDGMVFLDLVQEVSSPGSVADAYGNVRIDTRRLRTEAAVQSGDTVMLAGLISDGMTHGSSGIPGLSRIPVIGGLFGTKHQLAERSEVIILLTPTLIRDPMEARKLTDEYGMKFKGLEPLRAAKQKVK